MKKILIILIMITSLFAGLHDYSTQEVLNLVLTDSTLNSYYHDYSAQEVLNLVYDASNSALRIYLDSLLSCKIDTLSSDSIYVDTIKVDGLAILDKADIAELSLSDNTSAKILLGDGSKYVAKSVSGDATIDANGVVSLSPGTVADSSASTRKELVNVSSEFSGIGTDTTYLYAIDDGSSVKIMVTVDDNGNEGDIDLTPLYQGVEWDQSGDTYRRLGSTAGMAKSTSPGNDYLPIQSDMKRCLLNDNGTVNYYLDADNSMMKQYTTIPYSDSINYVNGDTIIVTGASFSTTADTGMWVHNVDSTLYAWIKGICSDDTLILSDSIFVVGDSINQYNAILNGDDGQVMVEIPKFYEKYNRTGDILKWYVSKYDLTGFDLHPAFWKDGQEVDYRYMSAFEGSMYDDNISAMCPDANIEDDRYASGDKMCSVAGYYPKTNETRAENRAMAAERGSGWRQVDYYLHSAIQLLYLIEYADFNSQSVIGNGRTMFSDGAWEAANQGNGKYIGRCGYSLADGNGTNATDRASSTDISAINTETDFTYHDYMTYRGIENFFGNVWKMLDGITWDGRWTGSAAAQPVYVTNNSSDFQDEARVNMQHLCDASYIGTTAGYIGDIENATGFIPSNDGGSETTYLCDNYWQYSENGRDYWRLVLVGANTYDGLKGGVFSLHVNYASGNVNAYLSGRLAY